MDEKLNVAKELRNIAERAEEFFDEFGDSLIFIKDLAENTGFDKRIFLCDLIGAMLQERVDTLNENIGDFTCSIRFITGNFLNNVLLIQTK